jgi:hypothetical protein
LSFGQQRCCATTKTTTTTSLAFPRVALSLSLSLSGLQHMLQSPSFVKFIFNGKCFRLIIVWLFVCLFVVFFLSCFSLAAVVF